MSATSSSRKRHTSSRKTPNGKSNVKSRKNVLQILSSSSDDDDDNYHYDNNETNDNSNVPTNDDNSNNKTNDNDDEDFNEENEHECKVASQIGTQDRLSQSSS